MTSFVHYVLIFVLFLVVTYSTVVGGMNDVSNENQVLVKREFNPTLKGR